MTARILWITFAAALAILAVTFAEFAGAGRQATHSQDELTGTWDVSGSTWTSISFTCVMDLVHGPISSPSAPYPPLPSLTPVPVEDILGNITCTSAQSFSSASISGTFSESSRLLIFNAPGLFGCGSTFGRAQVSSDGNSMSSGTFECQPQIIAGWTATRRPAPTPSSSPVSECPQPTPTPTSTLVPSAPGSMTPSPTPSPPPLATSLVLTLCNDGAVAASDLHISLNPSASNLNPLIANAPGCLPPAYDYGDVSFYYFEIGLDWGVPCVDPGEAVTLVFSGDCVGPVPPCWTPAYQGHCWTLNGVALPPCVPVSPTPTSTPPPTPAPSQCAAGNPVVTITTLGKGQDREANATVTHQITGNIVGGTAYSPTANRIKACAGTAITVTISGVYGPGVSGIDCIDFAGIECSVDALTETVRYRAESPDRADVDRIALVPVN